MRSAGATLHGGSQCGRPNNMAQYKFEIRDTIKSVWYSNGEFKRVPKGTPDSHGPYQEGDIENLTEVDKYICDLFGEKLDPKMWSQIGNAIIEWCMAALMHKGGGEVDVQHVDWILEKNRAANGYFTKEPTRSDKLRCLLYTSPSPRD